VNPRFSDPQAVIQILGWMNRNAKVLFTCGFRQAKKWIPAYTGMKAEILSSCPSCPRFLIGHPFLVKIDSRFRGKDSQKYKTSY
jgi:hypothetical protein